MLNPADHTYTGIITNKPGIISVTTLLAQEGYIDKRWYREGYADIGVQGHKLLDAVDKGLGFRAPAIYTRYIEPYKRGLELSGIEIVDSEVEIENPLLGHAGQLDKLSFHKRDGYGILDLKFSQCGYTRWHEFQTEGYRQALQWHPKYKGLEIKWRGGFILGPDCEVPRFIPHNRVKDIEKKWQALCIVNRDKREGGVHLPEISKEEGWIA